MTLFVKEVNMLTNMNEMDDLTFNAMLSVLQSGMWLLNDLEDYLRPLKMSQARLSILLAVTASVDGVVSPNEIAAITGKSRPAITRTIEKLSEQGFLSINSDFNDGRKKKLAVTMKGQDLLNKIIPEYNSRILKISAGLTEKDKQMLIELLGKIRFKDRGRGA